jgi:hypothetical protein
MPTLEEDLARLNFEYLMLVRECARSNPVETAWRFNLDKTHVAGVADMTLEQLREYAETGRAVIQLVPFRIPNNLSLAAYLGLVPPIDQGDSK